MQDRDERWVNGKGHEVMWRLVYHPGDLDTSSYPSRYAQRNPRATGPTPRHERPVQVLAKDGKLHYAKLAGGRHYAHNVVRLRWDGAAPPGGRKTR